MQSNAKQIYTIGFCVYQRNYLIINKAVISFRYAVFTRLQATTTTYGIW